MLKIDKAILDTSKIICKNIDKFDDSERGLLSQNILAQLRNLVEYIAEKVYAKGVDIDPNNYNKKKEALEFIKTQGRLRFLSKFHAMLQKSVSHYTIDEGGSERLMLKYYEYLLKIKIFLKDTYNIDILENIDEFPLNLDSNLIEYYEKIAIRINTIRPNSYKSTYDDRYYIKKIKPFFIEHKIYYEVTYTVASDKTSKFDRVIAFTNLEIFDNYAVRLSVRNDYINILGKKMPIQIIDRWEVSIRPCELNNFADIFGSHSKINTSSVEYRGIMRFLTETRMSIVDLVNSSERYYAWAKNKILQETTASHFFMILDKCKNLVRSNASGSNIIKYLLHKLNNKIIKLQRNNEPCEKLSNLYLKYGCMPFDKMPFATSLIRHNPRNFDLFECIDSKEREHEFLAKVIKNNAEINSKLFTPKSDIVGFDNIDELINKYNSHVYYKHTERYLKEFNGHIYMQGYVEDSAEIIKKLKELSTSGIGGYTNSVISWLQTTAHKIDSQEKIEALKQMFGKSRVALIYGSAGTGKSTLIDHISNFFNNENKIYLANTHPAVNNLRRKVTAADCEFNTIKKFLTKYNGHTECDLLIIDECSTVSNKDMRKVLEKAKFTLLVLVGDIFQIESILFGNWFSIARSFVPGKSVFELTKPYRSTNKELLSVWDRVRKLDDAILEPMVKNNYTVHLDDSIFDYSKDNEIILCLNYDGLYGINNINRFLQGNNKQNAVEWGINIYKINDPILFNESERFAPLIYNNMKGKIIDIEKQDKIIRFDIELDIAINELQAKNYDFDLVGNSKNGNSIISFWVNKYKSTDEDDDSLDTIVPFQISYAISIHKAQGLEYNSVKIVITNEVEERITHNIFYTAITRAKEDLKIYWTPETEKKVLNSFELKNITKDVALLKTMYSI
jgi:energy-coupling factor transporter ATP-binding protein EcfA2